MTKDLDADLLRTFVAAVEETGFARAAKRVHRSAPAVSIRIKKLEETIGARVFERDTRNLKLTGAGETLLGYARRILDLQAETAHALRAREIEGRFRIGAPDDYVGSILPGPLKRFAAMFPNVRVEVVCEQSTTLVPKARVGEVDLAFVTRARGIEGTFVRHEPMVWIGARSDEVWRRRPLPVALYEPGSVARARVLTALARAKIRHRAAYSSPSLPGLVAVVEAGLAIAAIAACAAPPSVAVIGTKQGLPEPAPLEIVAVRGAGARARQVDAFANAILEGLSTGPAP